jgi:hypothetical protein
MAKVRGDVGSISRPGKRWTAKRTLFTINRRAMAAHNWHVGEVLSAFNAAQASFFMVFVCLVSQKNWELGQALWHNQPSDSSQRKMLAAYVENDKSATKSIRRSILWSLKVMDELSELRNDAVHTDFIWFYDRINPGLGTKPKRSERLINQPFEKHWRALRGDFAALADYGRSIYLDILMNNARPSTKRPRLKLARYKTLRKQDIRRHAKKVIRDHQRRNSVDSTHSSD